MVKLVKSVHYIWLRVGAIIESLKCPAANVLPMRDDVKI